MTPTPRVLKNRIKKELKKLHGPGWQQALADRLKCSRSLIATFFTTDKVNASIEDESLKYIQELRDALQHKIDKL